MLRILGEHHDVEAVTTERPGHARELVRSASAPAGGWAAVVAFGGDGTVNEVLNGLVGCATPLGVLAGGATNVYCRLLDLPPSPLAGAMRLAALLDADAARVVDVGHANERAFAFCSGVGLDATTVRRVDRHPRRKARLGPLYFTAVALRTFLRDYLGDPPCLRVSVAGRTLEGISAVIQNGEFYAFFASRPVRIASGATLAGGTLAGVALEPIDALRAPDLLRRMLSASGAVGEHPSIAAFADATTIDVESIDGRPLPLQVDGDFVGDLPSVRYSVAPGALRVVA